MPTRLKSTREPYRRLHGSAFPHLLPNAARVMPIRFVFPFTSISIHPFSRSADRIARSGTLWASPDKNSFCDRTCLLGDCAIQRHCRFHGIFHRLSVEHRQVRRDDPRQIGTGMRVRGRAECRGASAKDFGFRCGVRRALPVRLRFRICSSTGIVIPSFICSATVPGAACDDPSVVHTHVRLAAPSFRQRLYR